jgi:hypothetical protein
MFGFLPFFARRSRLSPFAIVISCPNGELLPIPLPRSSRVLLS